jgi:hypothetical protein
MKLKHSPLIIAFCGRALSGKSTAAENFSRMMSVQFYGQPCYRLEFGDSIKMKLVTLVGGSLDTLEQNKNEPFLRWILENGGAYLGGAFFIASIREQLQKLVSSGLCIILVGGLRKTLEAELIHEYGGYIIRVRRYNEASFDKLPSEYELERINADFALYNSGDNLMHFNRECVYAFQTIIDRQNLKGNIVTTTEQ